MRLYSSSGVIGFRDLGRLVDFWELLGADLAAVLLPGFLVALAGVSVVDFLVIF